MEIPTVPQLAPEIRVLPMDELMVYEGGEEEHQLEGDQDGQIDVCALGEDDAVVEQDVEALIDPPSKRLRSSTQALVKLESETADNAEASEQPRSERYRILQRGNKNVASRARREPLVPPRAKNDDDLLLECIF
jgi:hypothetical protein